MWCYKHKNQWLVYGDREMNISVGDNYYNYVVPMKLKFREIKEFINDFDSDFNLNEDLNNELSNVELPYYLKLYKISQFRYCNSPEFRLYKDKIEGLKEYVKDDPGDSIILDCNYNEFKLPKYIDLCRTSLDIMNANNKLDLSDLINPNISINADLNGTIIPAKITIDKYNIQGSSSNAKISNEKYHLDSNQLILEDGNFENIKGVVHDELNIMANYMNNASFIIAGGELYFKKLNDSFRGNIYKRFVIDIHLKNDEGIVSKLNNITINGNKYNLLLKIQNDDVVKGNPYNKDINMDNISIHSKSLDIECSSGMNIHFNKLITKNLYIEIRESSTLIIDELSNIEDVKIESKGIGYNRLKVIINKMKINGLNKEYIIKQFKENKSVNYLKIGEERLK